MLNLAINAAIKAGKEILNVYHSDDFEVELKKDNSPLTIADKRSNKVIQDFLNTTDIPVLSEESVNADYSERKKWERCWIVDPLDGTKEFIKRNGEFTVNIALIHNSIPVLGVIYVPLSRELYFGEEGRGAYKINLAKDIDKIDINTLMQKAVKLPDIESIPKTFTVVASRSHLNSETQEFIDDLKQGFPDLKMISRGSSLKICMVAEGKAHIYPRFAPTMEWDTAAGHAIAKAADCLMLHTDLSEELHYNKKDLLNPWFIVKR